MKCRTCGSEVAVYELFPRSYRLYIYLCTTCESGFLAHHFDTDLDIYKMQEVEMRRSANLVFLTGLKVEPRVFDFKVGRDKDAIIVTNEKVALGELVKARKYVFAPYSKKALKILCAHLNIENCDIDTVTKKLSKEWEASK